MRGEGSNATKKISSSSNKSGSETESISWVPEESSSSSSVVVVG
jgi:hypothetical protein